MTVERVCISIDIKPNILNVYDIKKLIRKKLPYEPFDILAIIVFKVDRFKGEADLKLLNNKNILVIKSNNTDSSVFLDLNIFVEHSNESNILNWWDYGIYQITHQFGTMIYAAMKRPVSPVFIWVDRDKVTLEPYKFVREGVIFDNITFDNLEGEYYRPVLEEYGEVKILYANN